MLKRPADLPDFDSPPVAEVVLGLQFATESPVLAIHAGLYWQLIRQDFPEVKDHPPVSPQTEDLSEPKSRAASPSIQLITGPLPLPRVWFLDQSGNKLIQLQPDRFMHNWRRVKGDEPYPRFEQLWEEFDARWSQFQGFLEDNGLGSPKISQAELTYVNHIVQGSCWKEMMDVSDVFTFMSGLRQRARSLPAPETANCTLTYKLDQDMGRLHVSVQPVLRPSDKQLMLRMTLTVRGPVPDGSRTTITEWFQQARRYIVNGFTELTTPEAHKKWQRIS